MITHMSPEVGQALNKQVILLCQDILQRLSRVSLYLARGRGLAWIDDPAIEDGIRWSLYKVCKDVMALQGLRPEKDWFSVLMAPVILQELEGDGVHDMSMILGHTRESLTTLEELARTTVVELALSEGEKLNDA